LYDTDINVCISNNALSDEYKQKAKKHIEGQTEIKSMAVTAKNMKQSNACQFDSSCPVENALKLISGKWKPVILFQLSKGTHRFGELERSISGITQRILILQLRELERDGMIKRKVYTEVPPKVEYSLTEAATNIGPILAAFGEWFENHSEKLAHKQLS
jgi:DNA-binding HxlR family transcriptional regulator